MMFIQAATCAMINVKLLYVNIHFFFFYRLVTGGIPPDHYSYIIVDEAGQAIETECLIPIAGEQGDFV